MFHTLKICKYYMTYAVTDNKKFTYLNVIHASHPFSVNLKITILRTKINDVLILF